MYAQCRSVAGTATTVVTTVASHDTASAVVAVPATDRHCAYIASGTWSLVGLELDQPILSDASRAANFTNERGVDGRTRFLRNVGGLWLLQECLRTWTDEATHEAARDARVDATVPVLDDLIAAAAGLDAGGPTVAIHDATFLAPGAMPERIAAACSGPAPMTAAQIVRCIIDSLAAAYAATIAQAHTLAAASIDTVHIVGGGSQNALLCQLTADQCGLAVTAGPVEATALGNILVQARAHDATPGTLEDLRSIVIASTPIVHYEPHHLPERHP